MTPDETWCRGDTIPNIPNYRGPKPRRRKYSCWRLRASLEKYSYHVEDYIKDIISKITPVRDKIKAIPGANLMLCVWIDIYHLGAGTPDIGLETDTMRFLSEIGAPLDVDISLLIDPDEHTRWSKTFDAEMR